MRQLELCPLVVVLRDLLVLKLYDQVETVIDLLPPLLHLDDAAVILSLEFRELAFDFVGINAVSQVVD